MSKTYFFCGIGGSGMMPLAAICVARGDTVYGSDRGRDKGDSPAKFASLEALGIKLFPQDGKHVQGDALIVSSAVEDSVPDVAAAKAQGIQILKRAQLLAEIFNAHKMRIAIAGTSGKSTVTGMTATMLEFMDPTVMNGGVIRNFPAPGNMRYGAGDVFVTETDESDGTIELYNPSIAVLTNITLDHKSFEDLEKLFGDFVANASGAVILNADDERVMALKGKAKAPVISYGITNGDIRAESISLRPDGVDFKVAGQKISLQTPGEHNVMNALVAIAVAKAMGMDTKAAARGLERFTGIKRRFEVVGTKNGVTVIDDFAHNPDKITATLKTLKQFPGRLIVMFQPHGFGPLKLMGKEIAAAFRDNLANDDVLMMPEAYYAGGTADRSVTAKHVTEWIGPQAKWFEKRADIPAAINAKPGDRVVIMGARDDTLSDFAQQILNTL